jgi:hypothetical protein
VPIGGVSARTDGSASASHSNYPIWWRIFVAQVPRSGASFLARVATGNCTQCRRLQFEDGNVARSMISSSVSSSSSVSLPRSHPMLRSTACDGLPCPRSKSATAAEIRAVGGALPSRITAASVSIASCVSARAAALTVMKICLATIVSGCRGRPLGLPDTPGLKLVERLPPEGICLVSLVSWPVLTRSRIRFESGIIKLHGRESDLTSTASVLTTTPLVKRC